MVYLYGQERVTDKHHTPEHKAGFQNLSVKEPNTHGFKGISGWFLFSFYIIFSIKLVSYCVTIANYHLCSAAVPKVAGNLLKPPLGQEAAPFHACLLFSQQHLNTDSYLYHTRRFVCVNKVKCWELCLPRNVSREVIIGNNCGSLETLSSRY